jgi:Ca2+-binding EF-hand superfamily protein
MSSYPGRYAADAAYTYVSNAPEIPAPGAGRSSTFFRSALSVVGIAVGSVLVSWGLYRRHHNLKRAALVRRTRFLILHRFTSHRLEIVKNLAALGGTPFDVPELSRIHQRFSLYLEHPERGILTFAKFADCARAVGVAETDALEPFFALWDANHDSVVDFVEFLSRLTLVCAGDDEGLLDAAFAAVDVRGAGVLRLDEVRDLIRALAPLPAERARAAAVYDHVTKWFSFTDDAPLPSHTLTRRQWASLGDSQFFDVAWTFPLSSAVCAHFGVDFAAVRDDCIARRMGLPPATAARKEIAAAYRAVTNVSAGASGSVETVAAQEPIGGAVGAGPAEAAADKITPDM